MAAHQSFSGSQYADMQYWQTMSRPPGARFLGGVAKLAYGFAWVAVFAAGLGGVGLTLHRNDALLSYAQQSGKESPYLEWERRVLGVPGWGTPRSVRNVEGSALAVPSGTATAAPAAPSPVAEPSAPEPSAPEPTAVPSLAAPTESGKQQPVRETAPAAAETTLVAGRTSRPGRVASSSSRAAAAEEEPVRQPTRKSRVAARAVEDEDDGEPVSIEIVDPGPRKSRRAEAVAESEDPEPPKRVATKKQAPAPEAPKAVAKKEAPPAADDDNPLKAAIRSAILADGAGK